MLSSLDHTESQLRQNPKFIQNVRKLKPHWDLDNFEKTEQVKSNKEEDVLHEDKGDLDQKKAFFPAKH